MLFAPVYQRLKFWLRLLPEIHWRGSLQKAGKSEDEGGAAPQHVVNTVCALQFVIRSRTIVTLKSVTCVFTPLIHVRPSDA